MICKRCGGKTELVLTSGGWFLMCGHSTGNGVEARRAAETVGKCFNRPLSNAHPSMHDALYQARNEDLVTANG